MQTITTKLKKSKQGKIYQLKERVKGKAMVVNKETGEIFYGDNPQQLIEEVAKRSPRGSGFDLIALDPKVRFYFK